MVIRIGEMGYITFGIILNTPRAGTPAADFYISSCISQKKEDDE
jgi:hypothetical protein